MRPFSYERAGSVDAAVAAASADPGSQFIAGGTSQVDLMKEDVHRPTRLIDVSRLPFSEIAQLPGGAGGGVRIGATATNSAAAYHPLIRERYPAVSEALLAGASTQIRNMASMAGNLLQRTRCPYFRDHAMGCNKRAPGTGCSAREGFHRIHAVFGASEACIATHPSDLAVALAAHEAVLQVRGPSGTRSIPFDALHRLPGDTPQIDTTLKQGELITSIDLPAFSGNSHYLKVRERASYAYALVSVAVALHQNGQARIALGSVAHKPWRAKAAEEMLSGKPASEQLFRQAAAAAFAGAQTLPMNAYKVPLGRNALVRCLMETSGLAPLPGPKGTARAASAGGIAGDLPES